MNPEDNLNINDMSEDDIKNLSEKMDDYYNSDIFKHGMEVGRSFGAYETTMSAQKAHDMGEIDLWLTFNGAHSMEEWDELYEKYGKDFSKRWDSINKENE